MIKLTGFKDKQIYKRVEDGSFFKKDGEKYFKINSNSRWEETTDLNIGDTFQISYDAPLKETLVDLYSQYKSGTLETEKSYLDRLLLRMAQQLDSITLGNTDE